jgi:hypothetical protein
VSHRPAFPRLLKSASGLGLGLLAMTSCPAFATVNLECSGLGDTPNVSALVGSTMALDQLSIRQGKRDLARWGWRQTMASPSLVRIVLLNAKGSEAGLLRLRPVPDRGGDAAGNGPSYAGTLVYGKRTYWLRCTM